jgi:hypothetical protein
MVVRVMAVSPVKSLVCPCIPKLLPSFPRVMVVRVALPVNEVVVTRILSNPRIYNPIHNVLFLSIYFDDRRRVLWLAGMTGMSGFK